MKRLWEISGTGLETMYVWAESFDSALAHARNMDPGYTAGRVTEDKGRTGGRKCE